MITFDRKTIAAVMILTLVGGTAAEAKKPGQLYERKCHYDVYVKADGVRSTLVQGQIIASGKTSRRGYSRVDAALAAHHCLKVAAYRSGVPRECTPVRQTTAFDGKVIRYDFANMARKARRTLCTAAQQMGLKRVRGVQIYVKVRGSSRDVRRECSLPATVANAEAGGRRFNPYFTVRRMGLTICSR